MGFVNPPRCATRALRPAGEFVEKALPRFVAHGLRWRAPRLYPVEHLEEWPDEDKQELAASGWTVRAKA